MRFNLVPGRTVESELTSSIAAWIAGFADLPITESKVNRVPIFKTLGFEEETLALPELPTTLIGTHIQKITESSVLFMSMESGLGVWRFSISNKALQLIDWLLFWRSGQHYFKMASTCHECQYE